MLPLERQPRQSGQGRFTVLSGLDVDREDVRRGAVVEGTVAPHSTQEGAARYMRVSLASYQAARTFATTEAANVTYTGKDKHGRSSSRMARPPERVARRDKAWASSSIGG